MITPGYYRVNQQALSFAGMVRMSGWWRAPLRYLVTRLKDLHVFAWGPTTLADLECGRHDLSPRFWEATARQRADFVRLGFSELGYKKIRHNLNGTHRDDGAAHYLDASHSHYGQVVYTKSHVPRPVDVDREAIVISFTAVFEDGQLSHTNTRSPFDRIAGYEVVVHDSDDMEMIYRAFLEHLSRRPGTPRTFPDLEALRDWFDTNHRIVFEERVRSGLYVRATDAQIEAAHRRLTPRRVPPPLPKR